MIRVTYVSVDGAVHEAVGNPGDTVMTLAVANGVPGIDGDCGGALACGTCHVRVAPEWQAQAGAPSDHEACMLEVAIDPLPSSRLGCQIVLSAELDGLVVHTPGQQKA